MILSIIKPVLLLSMYLLLCAHVAHAWRPTSSIADTSRQSGSADAMGHPTSKGEGRLWFAKKVGSTTPANTKESKVGIKESHEREMLITLSHPFRL
mmetsp:Transcript_12194/g.15945  ORF Transcript_12194/g.15945 Transcript_12194/m.15945 type:complete len:96 (+) Transcript_12194:154-441(+)